MVGVISGQTESGVVRKERGWACCKRGCEGPYGVEQDWRKGFSTELGGGRIGVG